MSTVLGIWCYKHYEWKYHTNANEIMELAEIISMANPRTLLLHHTSSTSSDNSLSKGTSGQNLDQPACESNITKHGLLLKVIVSQTARVLQTPRGMIGIMLLPIKRFSEMHLHLQSERWRLGLSCITQEQLECFLLIAWLELGRRNQSANLGLQTHGDIRHLWDFLLSKGRELKPSKTCQE